MSGGVDSSVAAALLKKKGYEVVGVFMKLWGEEEGSKCCSEKSGMQARRVAQKLKIPLYVFNYKEKFKKIVVDYYISEYEKGRTPNPCVVCNQQIKFGLLLERAKILGAKLATGHYVRIGRNRKDSKANEVRYSLLRGVDKEKDQSYFLWKLKEKDLKRIIFPLGDRTKSEVRQIAQELKLPPFSKKDSQGVCFISARDNRRFLVRYGKKLLKGGRVFSIAGKEIGRHKGLYPFTVGQRHGLELNGIIWTKKPAEKPPLYVIWLNAKDNSLIVGEEKDLYRKELIAREINWLEKGAELEAKRGKLFCRGQIRYRHRAESCKVVLVGKNKIKVIFNRPQRAITPGQSIVFYKKEEVLAGGIIE